MSIQDLRDEAYTRILLKKSLNQFSINDFNAAKVWIPKADFETLNQFHPNGILYIVAGNLGDRVTQSRTNTVLTEYSVKLGFQKVLPNQFSVADVDALVDFIEELDSMMRYEIALDNHTYNRTEYERDPESGLLLNFIRVESMATFEVYSTIYYKTVLSNPSPANP